MRSSRMLLVTLAAVLVAGGAAAAPKRSARAPHAKHGKHAKAAAAAPRSGVKLAVVDTSRRPARDYQAETYSGVPLDGDYAKARGLDKGLVRFVFENERRATFRVPRERITKIVRLAVDEGVTVGALTNAAARAPAPALLPALGTTSTAPAGGTGPAATRLDVLETVDGTFVVETVTTNAGIFTTSDVYAFGRGGASARHQAALGRLPAGTRERIERALSVAAAAR